MTSMPRMTWFTRVTRVKNDDKLLIDTRVTRVNRVNRVNRVK